MKVSPIAAGSTATINPNEGVSASPDRLARAKAVASGQTPVETPTTGDKQTDRAMSSMKKIKMRTQRSPDRHLADAPVVEETPAPTEEVVTEKLPDDTLATNEPAPEVAEENKPLSPQFAALAKQKRALQLKEQELLAKERAIETQTGGTKSLEEYRARIKANALSVLLEEGVTYDQLTEQILASNQNGADLSALKAELKAEIKAEFEAQNKTFADRDAATETKVLTQLKREADQLIAQGDDYEMIREAGYAPKIVELIHKTFKKSGEVMDVSEAANLIENELLEESLKFAKIKKVQSRLNPAPVKEEAPTVQKEDRPGTKVMRTLTNRDGASSLSMSKRERAIAAMEGRLTK